MISVWFSRRGFRHGLARFVAFVFSRTRLAPAIASAACCVSLSAPLAAAPWQVLQLPDLPPLGGTVFYRSPQIAMLPDGRFVLAHLSSVWVQNQWGAAAASQVTATSPVVFDPSFIAVKDAGLGLIGAGGSFAQPTPLYEFTSATPTANGFAQIGTAQTYTGAYWHSPATTAEGWLIVGQVGTPFSPGGANSTGVLFVSINGTSSRLLVDQVALYSSGMAVDFDGNLYVASYDEVNFQDDVFRFSADQVEAALTGPALTIPQGTWLRTFASAGSMAVDGLGRIWAGGFAANGYMEIYDTTTGGTHLESPTLPPFTGAGSVMFQPQAFRRNGIDHLAFIARDAWDQAPELYYGTIEASEIVVPNTLASWQRFRFGAAVDNAALESTVWGAVADPDGDGAPNLIEYGTGMSPTSADSAGALSVALPAGALVVSFLRDPLNQDLDYVIETSGSMAPNDWHEIARSTGGAATVSSGIGAGGVSEVPEGKRIRVTVSDSESASGALRRFARLRVELQ